MKLVFKGWRREVKPHVRSVTPVEFTGRHFLPDNDRTSLVWSGPLKAYGKLTGLALSGSFLVEFEFEEQELRSWLEQYVKAHPAEAIRCKRSINPILSLMAM